MHKLKNFRKYRKLKRRWSTYLWANNNNNKKSIYFSNCPSSGSLFKEGGKKIFTEFTHLKWIIIYTWQWKIYDWISWKWCTLFWIWIFKQLSKLGIWYYFCISILHIFVFWFYTHEQWFVRIDKHYYMPFIELLIQYFFLVYFIISMKFNHDPFILIMITMFWLKLPSSVVNNSVFTMRIDKLKF